MDKEINELHLEWKNLKENIDLKSDLTGKIYELEDRLQRIQDNIIALDVAYQAEKNKQSEQKLAQTDKRNITGQTSGESKEGAVFKSQQAIKLENYKAQVEKKREEKEEKKKKELVDKSALATLNKENKKEVSYFNDSMRTCLESLKKHDLDLLERILNLKSCKYNEVCNLIVDSLKGKVLKIGNGTSHRRILLNKYVITISTSQEESSDNNQQEKLLKEVESHSVATDGFFNQHGYSHTEKELCEINIKSVKNILLKAGINLQLIDELKKNLASKTNMDPNKIDCK